MLNFSFCSKCNFSSFCEIEKQKSNPTDQINTVVKHCLHLKKKEILCFSNHKFKHLYAVKQGALKAFQTGINGEEIIRGFYLSGEILGYEAICSNHYPFSVVALSDTVVCEIPYNQFLELLQLNPLLQSRILHLISQQLNIGSYLTSATTAEQRIAAFLIDLHNRLHSCDTEFILPMSRQDIGNYLRLTAETVSRVISRFQKNKIIATNHKNIIFLQKDKLEQIAIT